MMPGLLDIVVASVHSAFNQDRQQMTDRILRAIENPHVDIIGHLTGRMILKRSERTGRHRRDRDCAARHGVALEINSQAIGSTSTTSTPGWPASAASTS